MKNIYTLLLAAFLINITINVSAQTAPCTLVGAVVTVPYSAPPIMMHAAVNGIAQYTFGWNDGTPVGSSSQKQFYSGWCVTITDISTGCDTTICESCIPNGGSGPCTMIFDPVCGCDGNSYSNACMAMQQGIFTYTSAIGPNGTTLPCSTPSWDCTPGQGCSDPGTGNGAYTTLADCQVNCTVTPTWDCNPTTGCFDPGTGQGVYSSLSACYSVCAATNINEEILNFKIYPNPTKNTLTIDGIYISATIYDVFGKVVLLSDYQNIIDVAVLRNGIYFIHINTDNTTSIKKITIAK